MRVFFKTKTFISMTFLLTFLFVITNTFSRTKNASGKTDYKSIKKPLVVSTYNSTVANIWTRLTNFGFIGDDSFSNPSFEWPGGSGNNYLYQGSVWIAGKDPGGIIHCTAPDEHEITITWDPDDIIHLFNPTDPRFQNRPNVDPSLSGSEISTEDTYAEYTDLDPGRHNEGESPLGIEILERTYKWIQPNNDDFIIFDYQIVNIGLDSNGDLIADTPQRLTDVYVAIRFDADVSYSAGGEYWYDDLVEYDSLNQISYMYDGDDPDRPGDDQGENGLSPGYIYARLLQAVGGSSSASFTDPVSHSWWTIDTDPRSDSLKFVYMSTPGYASIPDSAYDYRFLQTVGPFTMEPGDTVNVVWACGVGAGLDNIILESGMARQIFNAGYVIEGDPDISTVPSDTLDFGQTFAGLQDTLAINIINIGYDVLHVTDVSVIGEGFTANTDTFSLDIGESQLIDVIFEPLTNQTYPGSFSITSNDPNNPNVVVTLLGEGVLPPDISVTPDSLIEDLLTGGTSLQVLTISNNGLSYLDFNISSISTSYNYALQFDGNDDNIEANDSSFPKSSETRTITAWFKTNVDYNFGMGTIFNYGTGTAEYQETYLSVENKGEGTVVQVGTGGYNSNVYGSSIVNDGNWHFAAATYDGGVWKLYIDGEEEETKYEGGTSPPTNTVLTGTATIGCAVSYNQYFNGTIDEIRIWNVARSETEIQADMYSEIPGNEPGLVGYWRFNEGSGYTAYDQTFSGNHGSLQNDVTWVTSTIPIAPAWLSFNPTSGSIMPSSSQNIDVTFDASGMYGGDYHANLLVSNNDPDEQEIIVPVRLSVTGAPNIFTESDTVTFGQVFVGMDKTKDFIVRNTGTDDLLISSVSIEPVEYTVSPSFAGLNPGETEIFTLGFSPQAEGDYPGTLTFTSNDPDSANYIIVLAGKGVEPPIVTVSTDSISEALLTDEQSTQTLTIGNLTGASDLHWEIKLENIGLGTVTFTKQDYADWTNPVNQDRITENVWLTRANIRGLFNAAIETEHNWDSPHDTEWAFGVTEDLDPEDYQIWRDAVNGSPPRMVNQPMSLHLISDDKYFNVLFHSWTIGGNGGGFSYTRTDLQPRWLGVASDSGVVQAGSSMDIEVAFDATGLFGGDYNGSILISSNDPFAPEKRIPVYLNVTGVPDIEISFAEYDSTSIIYWDIQDATTIHTFDTPLSPVGNGILTVTVNGDFGGYDQYADIYIESDIIGTINPYDLGTSTRNFTIPELDLKNYIIDGTVEVTVDNSTEVYQWYDNEYHSVQLTYAIAADTLDFAKVFVNYTSSKEIAIANCGTDVLEISSIEVDNGVFSVSPTSLNINYGEKDTVEVQINPSQVGSYTGVLTITCNDPDEATIEMPVRGRSIEPPVISVSPDSLSAELFTGDTTSQILTISNTGASDLNFNITKDYSISNGSQNYAFQFDGVDDGISINDNSSFRFGTGDFTIEAWIYINALTGSSGWNAIITKTVDDDGSWLFRIANNYGSGYVPKLNFETNIPNSRYYGNTELVLNTWYHVAVKREGITGTFYLNGVEDGTFTNNEDLNTSSTMYISDQGNVNNERFTGIIDEVRIWNVARQQADIQADMYREIPGDESGLIGYWRFNEGSGIITFDQTINGNNGSLQGGVQWIASTAPLSPAWFSIHPKSGTIPAGNSLNIKVKFDATDLSEDYYNAYIFINSDDPACSQVRIPVHLKVDPSRLEDPFIGKVPKNYVLFQNFPNPFNPITQIRYGLPKNTDVKIELYNILGQRVVILLDAHMPAGYHIVEFDGTKLASGIYLYKIEAGAWQDVKKMILIR